jgi:7,8-dihydropterin-6-yl-methyl-4-(beta-D-ribofuranosyl)aminobenzene 5'-phosphate synthase
MVYFVLKPIKEMPELLKIKILVENQVNRRGLLAEHGLSILITIDGINVLFDAGQTGVLTFNAQQDGIDLRCVDAVVLSHGHYDHTGGIPHFCKLNRDAPLYIHPKAFAERFNSSDGKPSGAHIGIPWTSDDMDSLKNRIITSEMPLEIHKNVILSGEVERTVSFESGPSSFLLRGDNNRLCEDRVIDEQFLTIKRDEGIYIFVGCSHPGIINCIRQAKNLFPNERIAAVIGGMHLRNVGMQSLQASIRCLLELGVDRVIPLHCTGFTAVYEMKKALQDRMIVLT